MPELQNDPDFSSTHRHVADQRRPNLDRVLSRNDRRLMILGAGRDQVPIIRRAKQMGFQTLVVSIDGAYPGFSCADKSYRVDVIEKEQILEIAQQEGISGILTDQLDQAVPAVAYVAEHMGLPGIGYACALRFTNKYHMRELAQQAGIPVPSHFRAVSLEEARRHVGALGFPLMLKPVDGSGSRGVSKVNNADELEPKFLCALQSSRCGDVILESYFSGKEVIVCGFVQDFEVRHLVMGDRYHFNIPDLFIPSRTFFPSLLQPELQKKILDLDARLFRSLGPRFGNTYSEWLINEQSGEVQHVESSIRGGGVFVSSDLVPLSCGIDVNTLLIEIASGNRHAAIDESQLRTRASGYVAFSLPGGTIRGVSGIDRIRTFPGVERSYLGDLQVGRQTLPMKDKGGRWGPILISGPDRRALDHTVEQIQATLTVAVETSAGMRGIQW
jgi:biotin carboxylase